MGESIYSLQHFREYLQRGACSIIQADVARIGGITPWLQVRAPGRKFQRADLPAFSDGAACQPVQRCRTRPGEYIPQLGPITRRGHVDGQADGFAMPSDEAGIGINWNWQAIREQAIRHISLPATRFSQSRAGAGLLAPRKPSGSAAVEANP